MASDANDDTEIKKKQESNRSPFREQLLNSELEPKLRVAKL